MVILNFYLNDGNTEDKDLQRVQRVSGLCEGQMYTIWWDVPEYIRNNKSYSTKYKQREALPR